MVDGGGEVAAGAQFFLHAFEDKDIGVNGEADREDETCDAGQGYGDR